MRSLARLLMVDKDLFEGGPNRSTRLSVGSDFSLRRRRIREHACSACVGLIYDPRSLQLNGAIRCQFESIAMNLDQLSSQVHRVDAVVRRMIQTREEFETSLRKRDTA